MIQEIKAQEEQNKEKAVLWVEVITKTQQKEDKAEKWIEVAKKGKIKTICTRPLHRASLT